MSSGGPSYEQLAALVVEQAAVIEQLRGRVVELDAEVVELRWRLAQNSRNSSRPSSSDGLAKPPAPQSLRRPSGREPGGQPGHRGERLAQVEVPDEIIEHVPSVCAGCHGELHDAVEVASVSRQVFDLPEIRLRVCEHRAWRLRCRCGHETTAEFPVAVCAPTQYGPRVRALALYLVAAQHLPYQRAAGLLSDWVGADISAGTLASFVARGAEDLQPFLDHVFLLERMLAHVEALEDDIVAISARVEEQIAPFEPAVQLLRTIPGVERRSAEVIIAETGAGMSRFPSAAHLAS